jgi:outer membrane protein assembly factor BamB
MGAAVRGAISFTPGGAILVPVSYVTIAVVNATTGEIMHSVTDDPVYYSPAVLPDDSFTTCRSGTMRHRNIHSVVHIRDRTIFANEADLFANVTLLRDGLDTDPSFSVDLVFADGTATAPADYSATVITVTFASGELEKMVAIPVVLDTDFGEGNETFTISMQNLVLVSGTTSAWIADAPYHTTNVTIINAPSPYSGSSWPRMGRDNQISSSVDATRSSPSTASSFPPWIFALTPAAAQIALAGTQIAPDGSIRVATYSHNRIISIDPHGALEWSVPTLSNCNRPCAINANGTAFASCRDRNVRAIAPDGTLLWTYTHPVECDHGVVLAGNNDESVIFGCDGGKLVSLQASDGSVNWISPFTAGADFVSFGVSVSPDAVFAGNIDGKIYKADLATGTKLWDYTAGSMGHAAPTLLTSGRVVIGTRDTPFRVVCLSVSDGSLIWDVTSPSARIDSPIATSLDESVLYVASHDNNLYALDAATGATVWAYAAGGLLYSSAVVALDGATVYVSANNGALHAIDAASGTAVWTYTVGGAPLTNSAPSLAADGTLYYSANPNQIHHVVPNSIVYLS